MLPNTAAEHVQEGAVDRDAQKAQKHRESAMANALNDLFLEMQRAHTNTLDQAEGLRLLRMPWDGDCFYHTMQTLLARAFVRLRWRRFVQRSSRSCKTIALGMRHSTMVVIMVQQCSACCKCQAAANAWGLVIVVHQPHTDPIITVPENPLRETILQVHLANQHYDALDVVEAEVQPEAVASGGEEDMDCDDLMMDGDGVQADAMRDTSPVEEEPEALSLPSVKAEVADEDIGDDRIGDIMQDLVPAEKVPNSPMCVWVCLQSCVCVCVCVCPCVPPPPLPATVASLHSLA